MNSFGTLSDDFGASMYLASKAELPTGRETVLHFFESVQKQFPRMSEFERRDANEFLRRSYRKGWSI